MEDFDFEVGLDVVGFNFKIAGQPTIVVSGNRLNYNVLLLCQKQEKEIKLRFLK